MSLPLTNPPSPTDWMSADGFYWWAAGPFNIAAGATLSFPNDGTLVTMPPVYGAGLLRVPTYFAWDLLAGQFDFGQVIYAVGVSNPSEQELPMRPFTGLNYPTPINAHPGRNDMKRVDAILEGVPLDLRSWTMNAGAITMSGRQAYPSLSPYVTNNSPVAITVGNVQIISTVER